MEMEIMRRDFTWPVKGRAKSSQSATRFASVKPEAVWRKLPAADIT
jgi:hypothetical protein